MLSYTFLIPFRLQPYVRMTRRGKFTKPEARVYLESQSRAGWTFKQRMLERGWEMLPQKTPLGVRALFQVDRRVHTSDLDNALKALIDSAQGVVFKNDLWIDSIAVERERGSQSRVMVEFRVLEPSHE